MATSASASTKWPASLLIDVAGPSLTAEASGGLLALLAGVFPGSGSAWLGPSQKGDLPKFRRAASSVGSRLPTRAKPNGERPRGGVASPGPPASLGPKGVIPKQDALR